MKKRVILLGDKRKRGVLSAVERISEWIRESADIVAVDLVGELDLGELEADLAVVFGGDGSILATARRMGSRPIPTVGVNYGTFGFLTDISADDVRDELGRVLTGDYVVEWRLMLKGSVVGSDMSTEYLALNEFYVGPSTVGRMVGVEVFLNGEYAITCRGDGILVSSPTGSTGHALSAGGPIVDPELAAILLTPVSPHSLSNRPLVVPPDVTVELVPQKDHRRNLATFTADGQVVVSMRRGQKLIVTRSEARFPLVRSGLRTRYDVLRNRLGWSGQPPYENKRPG